MPVGPRGDFGKLSFPNRNYVGIYFLRVFPSTPAVCHSDYIGRKVRGHWMAAFFILTIGRSFY